MAQIQPATLLSLTNLSIKVLLMLVFTLISGSTLEVCCCKGSPSLPQEARIRIRTTRMFRAFFIKFRFRINEIHII